MIISLYLLLLIGIGSIIITSSASTIVNVPKIIVKTLCGNGVPGTVDGSASYVRFSQLSGITINNDGTYLLATEKAGKALRYISISNGTANTFKISSNFTYLCYVHFVN